MLIRHILVTDIQFSTHYKILIHNEIEIIKTHEDIKYNVQIRQKNKLP